MQKVIIYKLALTILLTVLFNNLAIAADSAKTEAISAAKEFLLLVDTSQYAKSWDISSSFFKSQIPKETWVKQISSLRPAFGKVKNRQILGAQLMTELPGAPDGQYVVIQYNTSFDNKRKAMETITPMLDKDGIWRVSGYYIQ